MTDSLLQRITKNYKPPITSIAGKGIVIVLFKDKSPVFLFDVKDEGYPVKAFIGSHVVTGGNWTDKHDELPYDTYVREIHEEFWKGEDGQGTEDTPDSKIAKGLAEEIIRTTDPLFEALYVMPSSAYSNDPTKNPMIGINSYFSSKINGDRLYENLGISSNDPEALAKAQGWLTRTGKEGARGLVTLEQLTNWDSDIKLPFDEIPMDAYLNKFFGYKIRLNLKVKSPARFEFLDTSPLTPYKERPEEILKLLKINPLREGSTSDSSVYEG